MRYRRQLIRSITGGMRRCECCLLSRPGCREARGQHAGSMHSVPAVSGLRTRSSLSRKGGTHRVDTRTIRV